MRMGLSGSDGMPFWPICGDSPERVGIVSRVTNNGARPGAEQMMRVLGGLRGFSRKCLIYMRKVRFASKINDLRAV